MTKSSAKTVGVRIWEIKTPWTLLLNSGSQNNEFLERLVATYLDPVYAFYRAQGLKPADAEDLTQNVLLDFFVIRKSHKNAAPAQGRFRNYLLAAARNALLNTKKHEQTQRRGGGKAGLSLDQLKSEGVRWEPTGGNTPDEEYERQWALATWRAALEIFRNRHDPQLIEAFDLFYADEAEFSQQEAAEKLGISVAAFNSRLYTARSRIFECVRDLVRVTVETESELNEELERIKDLLSKCEL